MSDLIRSRRMRSQSDKALTRAQVLKRTKEVILKRARYCCEETGRTMREARLDHHHVFGHHGLGAWNDSPECGAVLCAEVHRRVTDEQEPELKDRLRWEAVQRLVDRLASETGKVVVTDPRKRDARGWAMELSTMLDAAGVAVFD